MPSTGIASPRSRYPATSRRTAVLSPEKLKSYGPSVRARGNRVAGRAPSAAAEIAGPPGYGRPSSRPTLSNASPAASSTVWPSRRVAAVIVHEDQLRVAAADHQAEEREGRLGGQRLARPGIGQPVGVDVALDVVHADQRQVVRDAQRLGEVHADQQRADQAGAAGHRHRVEVVPVRTGLVSSARLQGRDDPAQLLARGHLRHDPAGGGVQRDLASPPGSPRSAGRRRPPRCPVSSQMVSMARMRGPLIRSSGAFGRQRLAHVRVVELGRGHHQRVLAVVGVVAEPSPDDRKPKDRYSAWAASLRDPHLERHAPGPERIDRSARREQELATDPLAPPVRVDAEGRDVRLVDHQPRAGEADDGVPRPAPRRSAPGGSRAAPARTRSAGHGDREAEPLDLVHRGHVGEAHRLDDDRVAVSAIGPRSVALEPRGARR